MRYALDSLRPEDRFALIKFATVVTPFRDGLLRTLHAGQMFGVPQPRE